MTAAAGLGRVAVIDRGESARRVLRVVRECARVDPAVGVAVHGARDRLARFVREADEALELEAAPEEILRAARADGAWLGTAPIVERAAFAEACERLRIWYAGPPADTLRRLCAPGAAAKLAERIGLPAAQISGADPRARLVEVLVARDRRGAARALGVGDASLQLREVAVLAESPSPALADSDETNAREFAVRACAEAGWFGLCTVRFLFETGPQRLALVELDAFARSAPAVEGAIGVDLVRLALRLGVGAPLPKAPVSRGHAFAARILARSPEEGPAPAPGPVELLRMPSGPGLQADAPVEEGDEAPAGTQDILATLVACGDDRRQAAARLEQALADADVFLRGGSSSKAWLLAVCGLPEVRRGEAGVGLLDGLAASGRKLVSPRPEPALLAAAIESYDAELDLERARFIAEARRGRPRVGPSSGRAIELRYGGHRHRLEVQQIGPDAYRISPVGGAPVDVHVERLGRLERRLGWQGHRCRALTAMDGRRCLVEVDGVPHVIVREPAGIVPSPMPAVVTAIPVVPGQQVAAGEPVARIESMKVEVEVLAPSAGIIREVVATVNGQVDAGAPLLRLGPLEDEPAPQPPSELLSFGSARAREPSGPRERYLAAFDELRRLLLGFDVPPADVRRLAARSRELGAQVQADDAEALRLEESALRAFADVESLFSRARGPDAADGESRPPPLEELWRYLHEPEARGEGLSPGFVEMMRCALSHYGVGLDSPGRSLELALLRIQKAYVRVEEQLAPILGILERRLAGDRVPMGLSDLEARALFDRLAELGQERFPALADLAREVRYRRVDQPALERARAGVYAQAEADLATLAAARGAEREAIIERLVACPQPLATLLIARMAAAAPALRPRLVETLLRRYYRMRPLEQSTTLELDGLPFASAEYDFEAQRIRVAACFALAAEAAQAARRLARFAADVPAGRELAIELYLWQDGPVGAPDELAAELQAVLAQAGFPRPLMRVSVVMALPGRGLGHQESQRHFTFRGGPDDWTEDKRYRGVHFMLFRRLLLTRLSKFDLERLPSAEDVYLYRAVAQGNPKDERLFAAAQVYDLTPVLDADGRVAQLPTLERMFHEALAGMRLFQARRAPNQRLEWNRVMLTVTPPFTFSGEELHRLAERLAPATEGLGLEMVLMTARVPDPATGELREKLVRVITLGRSLSIRWDEPTDRPLEPMGEYQQKVVQLRRRGLTHPFELVRMLTPPAGSQPGVPPGEFTEYDLDESNALVPVRRPPGSNTANVVVGVITNFTARHPEGMRRVALFGDPGREMGSVAEPECRRILAALDLAEKLAVPLEWFQVCAGAKISMTSGTENMDWISSVLRRLIQFTQRGGEINVVVLGITVGAQPYWNAEATMLMHTRGILVMGPGASMVLTGKQALEYSGSVSAEDNEGIGGYERIMGPNGQAQYQATSVAEAIQILIRYYEHAYVAPGERFPRRAPTTDPRDRDARRSPHGPEGGAGFTTVGDIFSAQRNPDRKKPFDIRRVMAAAVDQDHPPLERWRDMRAAETAVVWDAHLGGWPVCLIGIESRPLPRREFVPADGPEFWSAGTLFPQSSKKIARAVNSASGNRPVVVLANLSGFDGSPESMRRLQLEYGAEIGRAVVNFAGPIVFCVVSRYHGGAFVVFAKTLTENIEIAAVEGARASVIGGAPAAAVVFAREVETRTKKDPRVAEAEKAAAGGGAARTRLGEVIAAVRSEKLGEVGDEFDKIHSVERALKVGSLDRIIAARDLRPYLIDAVERGIARFTRSTSRPPAGQARG